MAPPSDQSASESTDSRNTRIGELFILGFRGTIIPDWLLEFEARFGLGGVILFDYNCQTGTYENNIESPDQVRSLCRKLSAMKSSPLIYIDQEGGKVRRLKPEKGFKPLPSAKAFSGLNASEKFRILFESFQELKELGFHFNLAPVIDLDTNPRNPDIGAIERSYSDDPTEVRENVHLLNSIAKSVGLGLCLKHFPGLGGATVNSHLELTDLTGTISNGQIHLFYELGKILFAGAVLISHGLERNWDPNLPASMSPAIISSLREKLPDAFLISDDLQMQGLQKLLSTREACKQGIAAGLDSLCIGNNLMAEDDQLLDVAASLQQEAQEDPKFALRVIEALGRVKDRKRLLSG